MASERAERIRRRNRKKAGLAIHGSQRKRGVRGKSQLNQENLLQENATTGLQEKDELGKYEEIAQGRRVRGNGQLNGKENLLTENATTGLQKKDELGKYEEIFWETGETKCRALRVRCHSDSEDRVKIRETLFKWLREEGVNVQSEKVLKQLQVGLYLGVCKVPGGFVCNTCILRHPYKTVVFRGKNTSPLIRHLLSYNNNARNADSLEVLDSYNPKGGRKRIHFNSEAERKAWRNARVRARRSERKELELDLKRRLDNAEQLIKKLKMSSSLPKWAESESSDEIDRDGIE